MMNLVPEDELVFSYTVKAADSVHSASSGVSVVSNSLAAGTGITIQDAVENDAVLAHTGTRQTAIVNPTTKPEVTVATADATTANKFVIGFGEALTAGSFTVDDLDIKNGTAAALVKDSTPATGSVESYTLTVTADASYELVTVQVKQGSVESMYGNKGPTALSPTTPVRSLDKIGPAVRFETNPTVGSGGPMGHQVANGPPQLDGGKAKFKITFTEELGGNFDGLQRHDIKITGGKASDADISGPEVTGDDIQNSDVYTFLVTPNVLDEDITPSQPNVPSPADITVEFNLDDDGPQIEDVAGNDIDLTTAARYMEPMKGTLSATFDRTPPTGVVTAPASAAPVAGRKLTFRAVFSEPVRPATVAVFDRGDTANLRIEAKDGVKPVGTDGTTYDIQVTVEDPNKPTILLFPAASVGSVKDLAGHPLRSRCGWYLYTESTQ